MALFYKKMCMAAMLNIAVIAHAGFQENMQTFLQATNAILQERSENFLKQTRAVLHDVGAMAGKDQIRVQSGFNANTGRQEIVVAADQQSLFWAALAGTCGYMFNEITLQGSPRALTFFLKDGSFAQLNQKEAFCSKYNELVMQHNRNLARNSQFSVARRTPAWRAMCFLVPAGAAYHMAVRQEAKYQNLFATEQVYPQQLRDASSGLKTGKDMVS